MSLTPRLYPIITALLFGLTPAPGLACEKYAEKAEHFRDLRRAGGTVSQMNRWQQKRHEQLEKYSDCRLGGRNPGMTAFSGPRPARHKPDFQKRRTTKTSDPSIQKLLATCNYWIETYNRQPNDSNQHFRSMACRALDEAERRQKVPPKRLEAHERRLDDCIKPGRLVDNEVQACLVGDLEPVWNE